MPQQLKITGKTNEEEAIDFIVEHKPENEPWFVGISGGKDSAVLYDLCKKSGVECEYYYSATGIDPPEVVKHIKRNYSDVIIRKPKQSFYQELQTRGFPTKRTRWCCDFLKKDPTADVPYKKKLMGIRSEESSNRSKRPQIDLYKNGDEVYKPIFYWKEWEIWEYIERHDLPYCSLYDEGFGRIGCVVCPFICNPKPKYAKWNLQIHKDRWPKIYATFERAMRKFYLTGTIPSIRKFHMNNNWRISLGYAEPIDFKTFLNNWYVGKGNFYNKN
jgi:phosphoadenosine phosphosulfate reductase